MESKKYYNLVSTTKKHQNSDTENKTVVTSREREGGEGKYKVRGLRGKNC